LQDELPFGGWNDRNGLDGRGLGRLLRPYGVKQRTVRDGDTTMKGYARHDFEDAWKRYLAPPPTEASQASQASHDPDPSHENPREHRDVTDVTDVTDRSGEGGSDHHEAVSERHNGALAPLPHNQVTEDEIVAEIVREFDAIELTDDCADPLGHAPHHKPHPDTSRIVCQVCHSAPAVLAANGNRS
jgi:Protein of unknown function (DUF3631)